MTHPAIPRRFLQPLLDLATRLRGNQPPPPPPYDPGDDLLGIYLPEPQPAPETLAPIEPEFVLTIPEDEEDGPGDWPDEVESECALDGAPYYGTGVLGRYCSWSCADADADPDSDSDASPDFTFEITLPTDHELRTAPDDPWAQPQMSRPSEPTT
ncbi:hypothetical protein AB0O82_32725 [Kitasatospora sp. NPDC088264]|uniref:hypothetical protein n=1 Tax=Kitasatospora sp. NPDC088264 TaxID=3155296 RepID=UPI00341F0422